MNSFLNIRDITPRAVHLFFFLIELDMIILYSTWISLSIIHIIYNDFIQIWIIDSCAVRCLTGHQLSSIVRYVAKKLLLKKHMLVLHAVLLSAPPVILPSYHHMQITPVVSVVQKM